MARHDVEPYEVEEVCDDTYHIARRQGKNRYRLYGQTSEGRYLFVVLERLEEDDFRPITARDMTQREKQGLRKRKK
ncbi:MAG: BrnT family toxin [Chloroflexota bacterium]